MSAPGGFDDDIGAGQANECVETAAQTILDLEWLRQRNFYGAHCWENPRGSMATRLHGMRRARVSSKKLHVDYCMFGSGANGNPQKSTVLLVSKWMNVAGVKADKSRTCDEARRCKKDGSCGGMVASPAPKHYAKEGGVSFVNAGVAELLVASVHQAWQEMHGRLRQRYRPPAAEKAATGLAAPQGIISFLAQRWDDKFGHTDTCEVRRPSSDHTSARSDGQRARAKAPTLEGDDLHIAADAVGDAEAHAQKGDAMALSGLADHPADPTKPPIVPVRTPTRSSGRRPASRKCIQCDGTIYDQRGWITRVNGLPLCKGCARGVQQATPPHHTTPSQP